MNGNHWSEDELLDQLYGVGPVDGHLDRCTECSARLRTLETQRARVTANHEAAPVDAALLLRQRRAVMERVEESTTIFGFWRMTTAFAAAAAMIVAFAIHQPSRPKVVATQTASSDTQFFSEVYSEVVQTEPRAVQPMRRLFQENP